MPWDRMQRLLTAAQGLTEREIHRHLGAIQWLVDRGHHDHPALFELIPDPDLRLMFPDLPADEVLEAIGQEVLDRVAKALSTILCSERHGAPLLRRVTETVAGLLGADVATMLAIKFAAALAIAGGTLAVPVAAAFCGHLIGSWLAEKGLTVGCGSLREYLAAHP